MSPKPRWRTFAGLAVLVGGGLLIALTLRDAQKQPVEIHVALVPGVKGLRLDVTGEGKLAAHLEWSYGPQAPDAQDGTVELRPGDYEVAVNAVGAGRDPAKQRLHVEKGDPAKLNLAVQR